MCYKMSEYEIGDLVLHMTISAVSSLFLSVSIYFFTHVKSESGSPNEMVRLVEGVSSVRQKRIDF